MIEPESLPPGFVVADAGVDASLLDLIDNLLDKGCVVTGELVIGIADVDLIYIELSALLCAADRLLPERRGR